MDSVIFDLDGTLWDSTEAIVKSWSIALAECEGLVSHITKQAIQGVMGLQMQELGEKLFKSESPERVKEILEKCMKIECEYLLEHGGDLYEALETTLAVLSEKYKLFIVSNCQSGYIEVFLKYHKLEKYFSDFENPGRTGLSKGENIKLVMKRNHLQAPVYVGDTLGDQKAAEAAHIPFVYAKYGFGKVERYDYRINQFKELLELLPRIDKK